MGGGTRRTLYFALLGLLALLVVGALSLVSSRSNDLERVGARPATRPAVGEAETPPEESDPIGGSQERTQPTPSGNGDQNPAPANLVSNPPPLGEYDYDEVWVANQEEHRGYGHLEIEPWEDRPGEYWYFRSYSIGASESFLYLWLDSAVRLESWYFENSRPCRFKNPLEVLQFPIGVGAMWQSTSVCRELPGLSKRTFQLNAEVLRTEELTIGAERLEGFVVREVIERSVEGEDPWWNPQNMGDGGNFKWDRTYWYSPPHGLRLKVITVVTNSKGTARITEELRGLAPRPSNN